MHEQIRGCKEGTPAPHLALRGDLRLPVPVHARARHLWRLRRSTPQGHVAPLAAVAPDGVSPATRRVTRVAPVCKIKSQTQRATVLVMHARGGEADPECARHEAVRALQALLIPGLAQDVQHDAAQQHHGSRQPSARARLPSPVQLGPSHTAE